MEYLTDVPATRPVAASRSRSPWLVAGQGAAALAAAMGVGRFAYTPILPLMHEQAGLSAQAGASLATANYAGYLAGAVAATVLPALNRSRAVMRVSLAVLIATLVLMPASHEQAFWLVLRLAAGLASALVFVSGIGAVLSQLRGLPHHLTGWVFSGVGAGYRSVRGAGADRGAGVDLVRGVVGLRRAGAGAQRGWLVARRGPGTRDRRMTTPEVPGHGGAGGSGCC